jgi:hypothetical protein
MDLTTAFSEIVKTAPQEDGSLLVYGKATGSDLDMDEQRCDPAWLSTAMPEWFRTAGNVREQHDAKRAVGKAIEHETIEDGSHMIRARVVDPVAKAKVEAGILTGFSIGIKSPRIAKSADAKNGLIVGGQIVEISLVDRPCLPTATLTMCKAAAAGWEGSPADLDEDLGLVKCEELSIEKAADVVEDAAPVEDADKAADADDKPEEAVEVVEVEKSAETEAPTDVEGVTPADVEKASDPDISEPKFDREAAKALVADTLAKAVDDGLGQDESGDIGGAEQAIAIIAQLVISEAQDLAKMPAQGCDIHLLMSAVDALRCFSRREQAEQSGVDPDQAIYLGADADATKAEVTKAKYSAEELRQMLKDGHAMKGPDGEPDYPIGDEEDLKNAIHAVGRGKGDHADIRAYIVRRAKMMGKISEVPSYWTEAGLSFAADADMAKTAEPDAVEADTTKTAEPEAVKATDVSADPDALVKALTAALEKADNPLRKLFVGIVEASTEATAKSLGELGERLVKVEGMATPGGPALRRTEIERVSARKNDLVMQHARYKALAMHATDPIDAKGYGTKAAQLEAEIKAL